MSATKRPGTVLDQERRLFSRMMERAAESAQRADPATGGSEQLVRNWGNDASRAAWDVAWSRWRVIEAKARKAFAVADHRHHMTMGFRPIYCASCESAREVRS